MRQDSNKEAAGLASLPWRNRPSLTKEIAEVLRDRIFSGHYPAGHPMLQVQLAEELQISRTPLRHALNLLVAEGLLEPAKPRGLIVAMPNLDDLEQAYLLREVVDGLAARLATEHATAADIRELRNLIAAQKQHIDPWTPDLYTQLNVEFHACVLSLANNRYLDTQLPLIRLTSLVFLPAFKLTRERAITAIQEHDSIVDAIEQQDARNAERLSHAHIHKTLKQIARIKHPSEQPQ